ncbi:MAG: hypothetical protein ABI823_01165 [Bryobacteraceae bacterium]
MKTLLAHLGNTEKMIAILLVWNLSICLAASPVIGTAQTRGAFQVDNSPVSGSAALFEGSRIQTAAALSTVDLAGGSRLELASESRARVFVDHAVIEQGGSIVRSGSQQGAGYSLIARSLSIQPDGDNGSARVQLAGSTRVQVAAVSGAVRVRNSQGLLVANLAAGTTLEFDPQSGASNSTRVSGCLQRHGDRFSLTDETTSVTMELRGQGLEREVGNNVAVSGTMEVMGDAHFVNVMSISRSGKGCSGKAAAAGSGGSHSRGWTISGTTIAIVGGVAAAATIGGLAAANKLPGQGDSPTISK